MPDGEQFGFDFEGFVGWEEIETSARRAFNIRARTVELVWAKEQWNILGQSRLTAYRDEFGRYAVLFRLLILGGIYHDFCTAWGEYSRRDYSGWADNLHLDPFIVGQLYARLPNWEADEKIQKEEALERLVELERATVVEALMKAFDGPSGLYASLRKSRGAGESQEGDHQDDDDYPDTYDPEASQMSAYSWIKQGCHRYR